MVSECKISDKRRTNPQERPKRPFKFSATALSFSRIPIQRHQKVHLKSYEKNKAQTTNFEQLRELSANSTRQSFRLRKFPSIKNRRVNDLFLLHIVHYWLYEKEIRQLLLIKFLLRFARKTTCYWISEEFSEVHFSCSLNRILSVTFYPSEQISHIKSLDSHTRQV